MSRRAMTVEEFAKMRNGDKLLDYGIGELNKLNKIYGISDLDIEVRYVDGKATATIEFDLSERRDSE